MISNLSIEEKQRLAELYNNLREVKKSQAELNEKTEPLNAELEKLEKQEKEYDLEYSDLCASTKEEDIEKLANITSEMVNISEKKIEIRKKLDEYEPDFKKYNDMVQEYNFEIDNITNVGVFGNGVVYLDKKGNVMNTSNEIKVEIQKFKKPEKEPVVIVSKNQIIETKKNVAEFIKEKICSAKTKSVEIKNNIEKTMDYISNIREKYEEKYNEYYAEEKNRVNQIIEDYKNKKAENAKAEEEAENIEFYDGDKKENIEDAMYIENEVNDNINKLNIEQEEPKKETTVSNENMSLDQVYNENNKLFKNIDKNDEELKQMNQKSNSKYNNIIQIISEKKNRVATAKPSKISSMIEVFNKVKENVNDILDNEVQKAAAKEANNIILSMKKDELEKAKEKLKEKQKLNYEEYQNSVNNINSMGMAI